MTENISWLNGRLQQMQHVSAANKGLLLGFGVFETIKVVQGEPHFLDRHVARLRLGCARMQLPDVNSAVIENAVSEVMQANPTDRELARLRITVTSQADTVDLLVTIHPMEAWPETTTCTIVPWIRNERSPLVGVKSTSYAENVVAQRWALSEGFSEGIFFNSVGEVCEGATSNIFVVKGDQVITPHVNCGVLPGIVREVLLDHELARESIITSDDLASADEIFLTSSTRGVHPVIQCGQRRFSKVGEVTKGILQAFEDIDPVSDQ